MYINVWSRFRYSRKWNCTASLFPKQNYIVYIVSGLYIPRIGLHAYFAAAKEADRSWEYINRSQIHECRNWEPGWAVSFLGIHISDFLYSVLNHSLYFVPLSYWLIFSSVCPLVDLEQRVLFYFLFWFLAFLYPFTSTANFQNWHNNVHH
jgi:hypothetical protein